MTGRVLIQAEVRARAQAHARRARSRNARAALRRCAPVRSDRRARARDRNASMPALADARSRSARPRHRRRRVRRAREGQEDDAQGVPARSDACSPASATSTRPRRCGARSSPDDARAQADRRRRPTRLAAADRRDPATTRSKTAAPRSRDFIAADGAEGYNEDYLWVYGRAGEPCLRCKTLIRRAVHQGRATYYCPTCQTP